MSMLRLVSRIVPTCCQDESISHLLVAKDIDTPVRTDINCSGDQNSTNFVVYETTFCKEKILPPNSDLDSTIASKCNSTPGLVNLKKSRLRLTTETREYENLDEIPSDPVIKVSPENLGDGTCAGILVSIPLRLSRREVQDSSGTSTFYFSAGHIEQQVVSDPEKPYESHSDPEGAEDNLTTNSLECDICGKAFASATLLQEHKAKHKKVLFSCEKCGKKFYGKRKLVMHLKTHEENDGFKCPYCESKFKTNKTLKIHIATHAGDLPYLCSVCPSKFSAAIDLRNHAIRHKRKKKFTCEECGKRYNSKDHFEQHCNNHRSGKGSFKCDVCEKVFAFRSNLTKHKRTHNGEFVNSTES
ncbi:zinc finger protein 155-like isoform X2 [Argiope bruennichi]|uniref:Zinc finger and BTB domain-containing protein like n=1 Tax=Argiope bruennichi TaxID=94029 RepID=A0A8T0ELT7_ARGBR|nr:zinc finger protein 155-like isoform X2 [Argiope bruennichi]KAF8776873.1 Zinc finger and BTB domain-containing protein like [Argiope bruennichi]